MTQQIDLATGINLGLDYILSTNPNSLLMGEDIGVNGGVFRVTDGLQQKYGQTRVLDTPLAENMLAGIGLGMATRGIYPIIEFQFMGFIYPALEQIISHITKLRKRTEGRLSCPMLMRTPYGCGIYAPEHHSESTESIFASIPGLRVITPSTPTRAFELLVAAHKVNDPILYLEPTIMYRSLKQDFIAHQCPTKIDQCIVEQTGNDLTLIAWGAYMNEARKVTDNLREKNIHVELIDLVSLRPIDYPTIISSVKKTGRCAIIQEAPKTLSIANEIASNLYESLWSKLHQPILTVCGYDCGVPYPQQEQYYRQDVNSIQTKVLSWLN
ncbi:MAG: transketolase C-terminal domain-containing protein [Gammaproteobacteria bacterium]|nr:transketolase C-terminal domain-containing protein [Gammaproteobacteria bacterium]